MSIIDLLTVQETAQALRVSALTVRRYIADGRLSAVRVGKAVRVRRDAVEGFLEPIEPGPRRPARDGRQGKPTSADDPLWEIVGLARSGGPSDVSENKRRYLADAYGGEGW